MFLLIILSILLAAAIAVLCILLTRERFSSAMLKKRLSDELSYISSSFAHFSNGELSRSMEFHRKNLPPQVQEHITAIKTNFNKITAEPLRRICFVGTDSWFEGIACARCMGERLQTGGSIAIVVTSSLETPTMAQRHRSFCATVAHEFSSITITETFEAHADIERCAEYVVSIADKVDGIYITGNSMVPGVAQGLSAAGREGMVVICHDLDAAIVGSMRRGHVSASVVCSPFAQGHDVVVRLFNHLSEGWVPFQPRLMQDLKVVTSENLHEFWDEDAAQPRFEAKFTNEEVIPLGDEEAAHPQKRILVLCEDWNSSFKQMIIGIHSGASEVRSFNCEVVVKVLNQLKNAEQEVIREAENAILEEKAEGLDGIAAFVGSNAMVQLLNRYSMQGIAVASFNSEPLSLRSMIDWLLVSSTQLNAFTRKYRTGLEEVDKSQRSILNSLETVASRSSEQSTAIKNGAESVAKMASYIDRTAGNEDAQTQSVRRTTEVSHQLAEMVKFFEQQVSGLKQMGEQVKKSAAKTNDIKLYSAKIEGIINLIDSISEQTNLLAFNAAVESSHAGEFGSGFKVISQEIRTLADQSVKSTASISDLISDMRAAVDDGIKSNNTTLESVSEQIASISQAAQRLGELSTGLLEAVSMIQAAVSQNVSTFTSMRDSAAGINRVMAGSTGITEENNATIQKINNEFSQMNEKFSDMSGRLGELTRLISIMEGTVSSFSA